MADYGNNRVVKLSANGTELLSVSGFRFPLSVAVTPDEVSAARSPTASASVSPVQVDVGNTVTFTGIGSDPNGSIVLYEWDFDGDGVFDYQSPTTGATTHAYSGTGIYNPVFRVTDDEYLTATDSTQVVRVVSLQATAGADVTSGSAPLVVNFTASFNDPIDGQIKNYQWDFDGDNNFDFLSEISGNISHTYDTAGTFTATLKVDDSPYIAADSIVITVSSSGPTAAASALPSSGPLPLNVTFTGSGTDPDGTVILYQWDFEGDGTYDWSSVLNGNTSHAYNTAGTYTPRFRVTDNDGLTDTRDLTIDVSKIPPTAVANASPTSGYSPLAVNFDATGSTDPDGTIVQYEWDYGECSVSFSDSMEFGTSNWTPDAPWGQITTDFHSSTTSWTDSPAGDYSNSADTSLTSTTIDLSSATSANLRFWHHYDTESGYDRGYVEISTDGGSNWTELTNYTGLLNDWTKVEIDISSFLPSANVKIRFRLTSDGSVQHDGWYIDDVAIESCQLQWNISADGTSSHTYTNEGTFTASLRVTDNDAQQSTGAVDITIIPQTQPTATASADSLTGTAPLTVNFTGTGQNPNGNIAEFRWNFGEEQAWVADTSQVVRLYGDDGEEVFRASGFSFPDSVSINSADGTVWVADTGNHQVVRLASDGRTELARSGGFSNPTSVSVNPTDGTVWVADRDHNQVVKLDAHGHELLRLNGFSAPVSVSVNPADGTVWVADKTNDQVVKLSAGGTELARVSGFNDPLDVSVNSADGTTWVADYLNNQVVKLATDGSTELARVSGFSSPYSVSVNSADGTAWVADYLNNQVVKLSADGSTELARVSGFSRPYSVSVDPVTGEAWVADYSNRQVVKLDPNGVELLRLSGFSYPKDVAVATGVGNTFVSSSAGITSHTFVNPGIYRVIFTVTDNDGNQDTRTLLIRVFGVPTVTATSDINQGNAPLEVFLTGAVEDIDSAIVKYEWDFNGDGTFDYESSSSANVRHVYGSAGTFNTTIRVTDVDGYTGTDSIVITVNQSAPTATASAAPVGGNAPLTVNFSGVGTDPDGTIATYEWDFETDSNYDYTSPTTAGTTHTYTAAGAYTATLRVTDNDGLTATATVNINVSTTGEPFAFMYVTPTFGVNPLKARFCGTGFDPDGTIATYEWDFDGDGTYDSSSAIGPTAFGDNMENGAGLWTADSPWGLTSQKFFSQTFSFTDSPGGNYADSANTSLTSATIDLSAALAPKLIFWHRYEFLSGDYGRVEVSGNNGVSWTQLTSYSNGTVSNWSKREFDLSSYAGNATVKIRFRLTSNSSNNADGWYIDNVWVGDCASYTYTAHGAYTPVLRVTDNDAKQATATENVFVVDNLNSSFIWVADYVNNQVVKLLDDGTELARISGFNRPRGVAVNPTNGDVWVTDTNNNRVVKLSSSTPNDYDTSVSKITHDSTSYNNPGALNGDAILGTGNLGGGISLDGNGDYVQIGDSPQYRMDSWTFEAWVKPASGSLSGNRTIAGKVGQYKDFSIFISSGKLGMMIYDSGRRYLLNSTTAVADQWYHVAGVYDGPTTTMKLYVNGAFIGEDNRYRANTSNTDPMRIGSSFCCGEYFNGIIDDVRVWNVARTATEIAANKDAELTGSEAGLVGYWKLNSTPDTPFHQVSAGFTNPYGLSVNSTDGSVWVANYGAHQVVKLGSDGTELNRITGFRNPWAVDVDEASGMVWVADTGNDRVIRFPVDVLNNYVASASGMTPDSTSGSNKGLLLGNAAASTGNLSGGVGLDGNGDYIIIPGNSALDAQSFTVEAWVKGDYVYSKAIFMRGDSVGGNELYFGFYNNSTLEAFLDNGTAQRWSGAANFTDGVWHHVALVYDSVAGELRSYVDGALYGTPVPLSATLDFDGSNALIGADYDCFNGCLGNYLDGQIDDVRAWNVARTETEIAANKDAELIGNEAGLAGYWKLNSTSPAPSIVVTGFDNPSDVAVDESDGSVWVADYLNNQVVKLAADGTELFRRGGFYNPISVSVNRSDKTVWTADLNNDQVVKLTPNPAEIVRVSGFNNPYDVAVNSEDGTVWVAGYDNDQVIKLASDGAELLRLAGFNNPISIAVDNATRNLNQPPVATASASPTSGDAPLTVNFTGNATDNGTIVMYEWDFQGDGTYDFISTSSGNTSFTYNSPGAYSPVFRVTDNDGMMGFASPGIMYIGPLSVSASVSPSSGNAALNVSFNGVVSGLAQGRHVATFEWDFEGDGIYDFTNTTSPKTTHIYNTGGTYTPILRVTDTAGDQAFGSATVVVNSVPPTASNSAGPTSGAVPLTANLNGSGNDPDGSIVLYEWDYDGDGTYDWFSHSVHNTVFTYTVVGTYNPTIRVTDNDGLTATASKTITVTDRQDPPVAIASVDATEGAAPLTVNFTGTGNDPDDGNITQYEWDFDGDGVYDFSSNTTGNTSHTYNVPGQYNVTLRVTDLDTLTDTDSVVITVKPAGAPTAVANANPTIGPTPLTVNFSATGSSDPDGTIALYEWTFGDEVVWVADSSNSNVVRLQGYQEDRRMTGFNLPTNLAVNQTDGTVWVSDQNNNQLVKLKADGSGEIVRVSGFNRPAGLAIDQSDGSVWVADQYNVQVVKLSSTGAELLRISEFDNLTSVALDSRNGNVWVADRTKDDVVELAGDGTELARIQGFNDPWWVAVNQTDGSVWVADRYNDRVVKLSPDVLDGYHTSVAVVTPDATSNGIPGYGFGNAAAGTGHLNGGLALDGTGDYIQIPRSSALDVQSFTIEAWIKPTSVNGRAIFMRGNSTGGNELYFGFYNSSTLEAILDHGTTQRWSGAANFIDGNWHHVALVYDSVAGDLRSYVDGALYGTPVSLSVTLDFGGSRALIGADFDVFNGSLGNYFFGQMDDVRAWNAARTAAEIAGNKDAELAGNEPGLVGYWKLNSVDATTLHKALGGFNDPICVSVNDTDGSAWVCDYYNDKMVKVASDAGSEIVRVGGFNNPTGAFVNQVDGSVWVADSFNNQVVKLSPNGSEIWRISGFNNPTSVVPYTSSSSMYSSTTDGTTSHTYNRDGEYIATLRVTDNDGNTDTDLINIKAGIFPESLPTVYPISGPAPLTVIFSANGRSPAGTIETFYWDFDGNGVNDWTTVISENRVYTYSTPGTYIATQRVVDNRGLSDSKSIVITVTQPDNKPTAEAIAEPEEGNSPLVVKLTGLGMDRDGFLTQFEWDFDNDGAPDYTSATDGVTTHTYTAEGIYTAVLRVTDNDGNIGADSARIEVKPVGAPTAVAGAAPTSGDAALMVDFTGSGTDDGSIVKYEWDFDGDGAYDYTSTTTGNTSHNYTQAGNFAAVLRVTDNTGFTDTDVANITVTLGLAATLSADVFDPTNGETVSINSTITAPVDMFTLKIKDRVGNVVRTLVNNVPRSAGYYSDSWDGKDDSVQTVGSGVYLYTIEYEVGGKQYVYDVTNNINTGRFTPPVTYPAEFNPFSSETNFFRYTLSQKSEVTVYMSLYGGIYGLAGPRVKTLLLRSPQKAGSYVQVWDGTNDSGELVEPHTYVIAVFAWLLPDNAIIAQTRPVISDLLTTPTFFNPASLPYDEVNATTFTYALSKPADVTVTVLDTDNFIVRTITANNVPQGRGNSIVWDGKNNGGFKVSPGTYRIKLIANDSQGNKSADANALVVVFY